MTYLQHENQLFELNIVADFELGGTFCSSISKVGTAQNICFPVKKIVKRIKNAI